MEPTERCKQCQAPIQADMRFCPGCGRATDANLGRGERRHLTILFCDMVDYTKLSGLLDPEDLRDLVSSYQRVCREAILRHDGHISQYLGDGVLAYFGYPVAHEDDAVRAIRAALGILETIRLVNQGIGKRLDTEIHIRVGIDSGMAVIGDAQSGSPSELLAFGEPVNMAARIQAFAEPDTVLCSATTARLVGGHFELHALNAHTLKGFPRPVELFRALRWTGARSKFEASARGRLTPHVGHERHAHLRELATAWAEVKAGADRVALVRGEPGIGKSRLIHEFRTTTLEEGVSVLECFCSPRTQGTALAPIIETINARVLERAGGKVTPEARLEALKNLLGEHSRFGADALPLIAALLAIPGADETPLQGFTPRRRRIRTLQVLSTWMAWSAERVPLALLVEDVQWADPSTHEFLELIVRQPPGGRTFVCLTARPEYLATNFSPRVNIELRRLEDAERDELVLQVTDAQTLPFEVRRRIAERSEGVPLFAEEITKTALESKTSWTGMSAPELLRALDVLVPHTLEGLMTARLDRLGESRAIARLAATIGREIPYSLIHALAGMTDSDLREHLDRPTRSELAFAHGEPPDAIYTFKHALIQETIYQTIPKREQVRLHHDIFTVLTDQFPERVEQSPELVAYHAEHAKQPAAAARLLIKAGRNALFKPAMAEAAQHLTRAFALIEALQEPERSAVELEFQAVISPLHMATAGWAAPEVASSCGRLRELAVARGDAARLFQAMWGLWTVDFLRGQLGSALEIAREVLAMAEASGDSELRVQGHHAVGYTHFYRGEYEEALDHARSGLALFDEAQERRIVAVQQFSLSCAMYCFRAEALQTMGREEEARADIARMRDLVEQLNHAPSLAYALGMQCFFFHARDDVAEVHTLASAMRTLSIAEGFKLWGAVADVFLAWAHARQGRDVSTAVVDIHNAKGRYDDTLTHITELELTAAMAETLILAQRPGDVAPLVDKALEITRPGNVRHYESELFRLKGEAARVSGDFVQAASLFRSAAEGARGMGATDLERRALRGLSAESIVSGSRATQV